ncbi:cellobiose phosphorylase [Alkalihalobacillus sp. 1P02AB]
MKIAQSTYTVAAGDYQFRFLNSGDIFEVTHQHVMINQWMSNPVDGSMNNLYLRIYREEGIQAFPLLGVQSNSEVQFSDSEVVWCGSVEGISYKVSFQLSTLGVWFWNIRLDGADEKVDIIYGQDIGLADKGAVRNNEAYLAQYVDHKVFEDKEKGYILCSRQNQRQSSGFPYLQQGALSKAVGYSTDGFQFFGLSYKETNRPEILLKESLANQIYQYEFAYSALQSEATTLNGTAQFTFYGLFLGNHEAAIEKLEYQDIVAAAWEEVQSGDTKTFEKVAKVQKEEQVGAPLQTVSFTNEELEKMYPNRHQEEKEGENLLSFFTDTYEHVVLKEKELIVERPHGHIIMSGHNDKLNDSVITSTSYMYGLFNAQLVVGNTNFNKLLSNARNHLNVSKTSGQRIYVQLKDTYQLLTMPSLYEIGFNYVRWYYKTAGEMFIITNYTSVDTPEVQLEFKTQSGKAYRYFVTNQVTMNTNEHDQPYHFTEKGNIITFKAAEHADSSNIYPNLTYRVRLAGAEFKLVDETALVTNVEANSASLMVFDLEESNEWTMTIQGLLNGQELPFNETKLEIEKEKYRNYFRQVMNGFHLTQREKVTEELQKVNALAWWYTHNMLVHFSVPHGLEQYGGAAWGTRDVCQGPTEYFMATQNYESVKEIIKTVYTHQYDNDGNWPQWFMFDKYSHIKAGESHGDIIVWPLKVVSDYLIATEDYSILEEKVPFTKRSDFKQTEELYTILDHIKKQLEYIKTHFVHDTYLSSYGDGDWDDTLQPANPQLREFMVSSWTVSLTYQVLRNFSVAIKGMFVEESAELTKIVRGIEKDFHEYMLSTETIPGFVYLEKPNQAELMLHPEDTKTGINYRLLPMTRSMIGELLTPEQAESHYELIKEKLSCPDGVRLMNRPAQYRGGVSTNFQRAEQASNFGREIGLQYVHAHIRFVEAMAKIGKVDEVWKGLQTINPVGIQDVVPNAERRQSNSYFSSSDGKFNDRYEAQDHFGKLRDGSVAVKGGWRIYSSGPGIYMNQLISNCLGIRQESGDLIIDPVIPNELNDLTFDYKFYGQTVTFVYHLNQKEKFISVNGQKVEADVIQNRYRQGGWKIQKNHLENLLNVEQKNVIDIYL